MRPYYEAMWTFWVEIFKFIEESYPSDNNKLKKMFEEIKIEIESFENEFRSAAHYNQRIYVPKKLIDDLSELHVSLNEIKHKANLGVWVTKPVSEGERLKRGI